jgi:hypothetical protein
MSGGSYGAGGSGQAIFTDDVSLQVFMEHLKRLVSARAVVGPRKGGYELTVSSSSPGRRTFNELDRGLREVLLGLFSVMELMLRCLFVLSEVVQEDNCRPNF